MKMLYLHVGTHKTGTTAIQQALCTHDADLAYANYLVPNAGQLHPKSGHHNIAWEISGDRRFQSKFGGVAQLLRPGMHDSDTNLILSSEDFSCAICRNPDGFKAFSDLMSCSGYKLTMIIYFRNQVDYMSSLYRELVRHGFDLDFITFCEEIIAEGQFVWRDWVFPFCYWRFVNQLNGIDNLTVIVRSYDHIAHSAVEDFANVIGLGTNAFAKSSIRAHVSPPARSDFEVFLRNRSGRDLSPAEALSVQRLLPATDIPISNESKRRIVGRFDESNRLLSERFCLPPFFRSSGIESTIDDCGSWTMESVFSNKLRLRFE